MKKFILIMMIGVSGMYSFAQELRCNISVSAAKVTGSNREVFQSMQMDLYEFMNNKKWSKHNFRNEERIECILISRSTVNFRPMNRSNADGAKLTPAFNSSYRQLY
jgi:hypothetical protein